MFTFLICYLFHRWVRVGRYSKVVAGPMYNVPLTGSDEKLSTYWCTRCTAVRFVNK